MAELTRQLAVIMFTDIAGYTALMGRDEQKAFEVLKLSRKIHKKLIAKFNGKWLKEMGDGVLASFTSVSDAIHCAGALQRETANIEHLDLSVGIHMGEVIVDVGDVFGDGVNIASRIESSTPAGSIYVSESVNNNLKNKKGVNSNLIREERFKNVQDPVKIYQVEISDPVFDPSDEIQFRSKEEDSVSRKAARVKTLTIIALSVILLALVGYFGIIKNITRNKDIREKKQAKSIVVLPFNNLGLDEDEYFAQGITEEITSRLSLIDGLSIISPLTAREYAGSSKSTKQISEELNVDFVLGGSIRWDKSGEIDHVRITTSLDDAETLRQVWGETIEKELTKIF